MNYEIVELDDLTFVGLAKTVSTVDNKNFQEIPKMWQTFGEKQLFQKLDHLVDEFGFVGISYHFNHDAKTFDYMIGIRTNQSIESLTKVTFKKQTFAKFKLIGPLPNSIQQAIPKIFNEWLPQSNYKHSDGPEIEIYTSGDSSSSDYICYYLLPITSKS